MSTYFQISNYIHIYYIYRWKSENSVSNGKLRNNHIARFEFVMRRNETNETRNSEGFKYECGWV